MSVFRPTVQQERWMAAAARLGLPKGAQWIVEKNGGWKTISLLTRCAFFVLGVVAAVLTAGVCYLMKLPGFFVVAGMLAIAAAELLITQQRLFRAGMEEALEMTGGILIVIQILDSTHFDDATNALLLALAFAIVGMRLLNALFVTAAAAAFSFWLYSATKHQFDYSSTSIPASLFSLAIAVIALAAGSANFKRPSVDRILDWLVIAMPACSYAWLASNSAAGLPFGSLHDNPLSLLPLLSMTSFAVAATTIGLRRRRHAPLFAAMLCIGCVAYELRNLTGLALELRLVLWGTLALLATLGLIAFLRKPRSGITSTEIEPRGGSLQLLELAGISSISAQAVGTTTAPTQPDYQGGGGGFSGGGASGKFY